MLGIDAMQQHLGQQEVRDRHEIMDWLKSQAVDGDIAIDPSTTAWCAASVNASERQAGNDGNGHLNARSFLAYGDPVDIKFAQRGDIAVFDFEHDGVHGHVTYVNRVLNNGTLLECLGGNQDNQVKLSNYLASSLVEIRRP